MLEASATPRPAMSNAVPWSTEVRMIGSPEMAAAFSERLYYVLEAALGDMERLR